MVETIIKWKCGIFKADPAKCYEEIQQIGEEVRPEQIVDKAKDESSELHKCFEWNDTVAAERFRLHQARKVLNTLIVVQQNTADDGNSRSVQFRVMMKNESTDGSAYKQTIIMVRDEDEYQKLLDQAMRELRAFKEKYSCLSELSEILALID